MCLTSWKILLAISQRESFKPIEEYLKEIGMAVTVAEDVVSALQHVEADGDLNAMVFDRRVLGEEADALLKAIIKLRPRGGLVVLCESPEAMLASLRSDIVFEPLNAAPETILQALLHAREMANARKKA